MSPPLLATTHSSTASAASETGGGDHLMTFTPLLNCYRQSTHWREVRTERLARLAESVQRHRSRHIRGQDVPGEAIPHVIGVCDGLLCLRRRRGQQLILPRRAVEPVERRQPQ